MKLNMKTMVMTGMGCLTAFLLGCAAGRGYRNGIAAGRGTLDAISDGAHSITNVLPLAYQRQDMLVGAAAVVILLFALLYKWSNQHKYRPGEEHGSAHWASAKDMAPFTDHDPSKNLQFTQTEGLSLDTTASRRNLNVCVVGGSGSGKTRSYVMPNIRNGNMSYAITDPKGEIWQATRDELKRQGYDTKAFNLVDMTASAHFNPMAYIDPVNPEPAILRMVQNIIVNTDGEMKNDAFWDKAERALLNALCAWVYFLEDEPDLTKVVDMVQDMEASEEDENHMSVIDATMSCAKDMLAEYQSGQADWADDMDKTELERILNGLRFAVSQYRTYEQGAGETKKSIIISLGVRLAPLQVSQIRALLTDDDIHLDQMDDRKTAIFMILPDTNATFNFLAAVFYQCLFETLVYKADHSRGGHLAIPVHCFLDEFANIGKIPNFEHLIATIRSRWISVSVIIQAKSQLEHMYKEKAWEIIVGNCDSILFLGAGKGDESTPKWISGLLGCETIETRSVSDSRGTSSSWSVSNQTIKRELLTADELGSEKFPGDKCIYMLRGVSPFFSTKIDPAKHIAKPKSSLRHARHQTA